MDYERLLEQAAAIRGAGPYITDDARQRLQCELKIGKTPFQAYQIALVTLDVGVRNIAALGQPDTHQRTWGRS